MTHPQAFGQKFTPIRKIFAQKTHPLFWLHIPNMIQYGNVPDRALNKPVEQLCYHWNVW